MNGSLHFPFQIKVTKLILVIGFCSVVWSSQLSASLLFEVNVADYSNVTITALSNPVSATTSATTLYDGVLLLGLFKTPVNTYYFGNVGGDLTPSNSGTGSASYSFAIHNISGPLVDLWLERDLLVSGQSPAQIHQVFTAGDVGFSGEATIDFPGMADFYFHNNPANYIDGSTQNNYSLQAFGYVGDVIVTADNGATSTVIGQYVVIPESSSYAKLLGLFSLLFCLGKRTSGLVSRWL